MLKKAVKEFALRAQRELSADIERNASQLGISPSGISEAGAYSASSDLAGERRDRLRREMIATIRKHEEAGKSYHSAYRKVLSEAAYSCFSCLTALRFLEVNDFLPTGGPVLSDSSSEGLPPLVRNPESYSLNLSLSEAEYLTRLKHEGRSDEQFTFLFIKICQSLENDFPSVFSGIPDYLELVLSLSCEDEDGLLNHLLRDIPEADFDLRQRGQVEIIGWFYQYYTEERRDEIISLNVKQIEKADIPTATQVFTPDWIVRYLLDNSLGRYWLERNPDSGLRKKLEFFAEAKSGSRTDSSDCTVEQIRPQELTVLDPCVGSGHILLYAFDLLVAVYRECGYSEAEAAREIVRHNLFGLDIDERVARLASFAIVMKARSYDADFLSSSIEAQVFALKESNALNSVWPGTIQPADTKVAECGEYLLKAFREAGEIGSLLQVEARDYPAFTRALDAVAGKLDPAVADNRIWLGETYPFLKRLADQAMVLSAEYSVVCTNPPYMNRFTGILKAFVKKNYSDYRRDLFSVYIYRNFLFCRPGGYSALMTPYVWMFIKSYEKLRRYIIREKTITTLIQLEYSAFDAATVPLCAFVLKNARTESKGLFIKLSEFPGGLKVQEEKLLEALSPADCLYLYESNAQDFFKLPSAPIAYWAGEQVFDIFEEAVPMQDLLEARQGLASGDNDRFLRLWFEVEVGKINFDATSVEDFHDSGKLYAPHNKGGRYRRWYGNYDYVIKFDQENFDLLAGMGNCLPSRQFYFREAISWSLITSAGFSIRYRSSGSVPNVAGNSAFSDDPDLLMYLLALLSTPIADYLFKMMNPTLNLNVGDFNDFPVLIGEMQDEEILQLAADCVSLARSDWDSFEVSYGFSFHPLADFPAFEKQYLSNLGAEEAVARARPRSLPEAYDCLKEHFSRHFEQLKQKEEKLNRAFIDLYALAAELDASPVDKDISSSLIFDSEDDIPLKLRGNRYVLTKSDVIRQFISYALGCILGRYSPDEPGLVYAGGKWEDARYKTFRPSADNIVTLSDDGYFDDDLVVRFFDFVEILYGSESLEENLIFIAGALSQRFDPEKEDPREPIRSYFLRHLYRDHCKQYSVSGSGRRPIYWLFDSGKENGFKAFIYMHRYDAGMFELMRSKYLQRQMLRYEQELADLEAISDEGLCPISPAERKRRRKKLQGQLAECHRFDDRLKVLADQRIDLDPDDGVLTNLHKLQTAADGNILRTPVLT